MVKFSSSRSRSTLLRLVGVGLLSLSLVGCGDDETNSSASSTSGAGGSGGQGGGGNQDACPADTACFDVVAVGAGPLAEGRLVVLWAQFSDDGPDPTPLIAFDAAFDGTQQRVEIPLSEIAIPTPELLLCDRACDDEAMCPCTGEPQLGVGLVAVVLDSDNDGKASVAEFQPDPVGIAYMALGYSKEAGTVTPPYDQLFPEGVDAGVRPYRLIDGPQRFDALGKTQDGHVFELNVCPKDAATCEPPFPNLT